jgi:hypothetical protein
MSRPMKHSLDEVRKRFEEVGYTLLEKEYKNTSTPLMFKCDKDHLEDIRLHDFLRGHRCLECSGRRQKTIEEIRMGFAEAGYTLISTECTKVSQVLEYVCPKGHRERMSWSNFRKGNRCPECYGNKTKTLEEIRSSFMLAGYSLLSTEYKNSSQNLQYRCPVGHVGSTRWGRFQQGHRCMVCSGSNPKNIEDLREYFANEGCALLTTEYKNAFQKLEYICPAGHHRKIIWNSFQTGRRCAVCAKSSQISRPSIGWLDFLGITDMSGETRERKIVCGKSKYRVDGFDPITNTVYEFFGDFYHGNPARFAPEDFNKKLKKSFGQLFADTFKKLESLAAAGYRVVYVWEKDFRAGKMISGILEPKTN